MSEIKLLPCPFCGGEARMLYIHEEFGECCVDSAEELEDETISAFVHCYGCSTEIFPQEAEKPKDVIQAWNTRKPMDDMVEQIEHRRLEYEVAEENASNDTKKIYYSGIKRGYEYSKDIVRGGRE